MSAEELADRFRDDRRYASDLGRLSRPKGHNGCNLLFEHARRFHQRRFGHLVIDLLIPNLLLLALAFPGRVAKVSGAPLTRWRPEQCRRRECDDSHTRRRGWP